MDERKSEFFLHIRKVTQKLLLDYAYRATGDYYSVPDYVHETYLVFLGNIDNLMTHPNPIAWLHRTLAYICLNDIRRRRRYNEVPLEEALEVQFFAKNPESGDTIMEILPSGLTEQEKQVLKWYFEEKLSYSEIAELIGMTEAACRQKVFRAKERCGKLLGK
jgi:RNA polymerase sigma-70 factor (ECF subfamily)